MAAVCSSASGTPRWRPSLHLGSHSASAQSPPTSVATRISPSSLLGLGLCRGPRSWAQGSVAGPTVHLAHTSVLAEGHACSPGAAPGCVSPGLGPAPGSRGGAESPGSALGKAARGRGRAGDSCGGAGGSWWPGAASARAGMATPLQWPGACRAPRPLWGRSRSARGGSLTPSPYPLTAGPRAAHTDVSWGDAGPGGRLQATEQGILGPRAHRWTREDWGWLGMAHLFGPAAPRPAGRGCGQSGAQTRGGALLP